MKIRHLIITPFNVGIFDRGRNGSPDEWTRRRLELFKKYTRPSIESQTVKDFEWVILVDPRTEKWVLDDLELTGVRSRIVPVTCRVARRPWFGAHIDQVIRSIVSEDAPDMLITTKLDSDDAVFPLFMEMIRAKADERIGVIDFCFGVALLDGRDDVLARHVMCCGPGGDRASPFLSVAMRIGKRRFITCCTENHGDIIFGGAMRIETSRPAYIRVIHGGNVINSFSTIRGITSGRMTNLEVRQMFGIGEHI